MTSVFHARPYSRFIEKKKQLWEKDTERIKVTIFLEAVLAKVCANSRAPVLFRRESLSILQDSQWTFTCSKLTIERLEQIVKYVAS